MIRQRRLGIAHDRREQDDASGVPRSWTTARGERVDDESPESHDEQGWEEMVKLKAGAGGRGARL